MCGHSGAALRRDFLAVGLLIRSRFKFLGGIGGVLVATPEAASPAAAGESTRDQYGRRKPDTEQRRGTGCASRNGTGCAGKELRRLEAFPTIPASRTPRGTGQGRTYSGARPRTYRWPSDGDKSIPTGRPTFNNWNDRPTQMHETGRPDGTGNGISSNMEQARRPHHGSPVEGWRDCCW